MCRWVAYAGPEIYLEDILFDQDHSIVNQSLAAQESVWTTNGDGFGVAWYTQRTKAGLFKDVLPAWNDSNLRSLAAHIRTTLFFAHVRATTGTAVSRSNCPPFIWKNWTFMHNGQIGNWNGCRKLYESHISEEFYHCREGTTDSEAIFLVALSLGLQNNPRQAIENALRLAIDAMAATNAHEPLRASLAVTDGKEIWAFRYSSDERSTSLYFGAPHTRASEQFPNEFNTIASEPSDHKAGHWHKVDEATCVHWTRERMNFYPIRLS